MPRPSPRNRHDPSRRYHDRVARQYDSIYDDPYWDFHDELTWRLIKPYLPRDAVGAVCRPGLRHREVGIAAAQERLCHDLRRSRRGDDRADPGQGGGDGPKGEACDAGRRRHRRDAAGPVETFELVLAMGDPLSICSDPHGPPARCTASPSPAASSSRPPTTSWRHWITTSSAAISMSWSSSSTSSRTHWLTADERERFELKTFTPATLRKLFEAAGFEVVQIAGKTIIPVRKNKILLTNRMRWSACCESNRSFPRIRPAPRRAGHLQITARQRRGGLPPMRQACSVRALRRVFFRSIATVIGPTPPGTGVIQPARFWTASNVHVAHRFLRPVGHRDAVDADVDDHRPFADVVGADQPRLAHRDDQNLGPPRVGGQIFASRCGRA